MRGCAGLVLWQLFCCYDRERFGLLEVYDRVWLERRQERSRVPD